jgi:DNA-directed RNA polymerase subunit RPC12/RpoP
VRVKCQKCGQENLILSREEYDGYRCRFCNEQLKVQPYSIPVREDAAA